MKVVLFCGGLGMRLRDYSDSIPKPMVTIGYRPVLWHVMKYYAYYGHTDLITNVGERLKAVEKHLAGEEMFLANYSDGLTDLPLPQMIDHFTARDKLASFVCVKTNQTFHVVKANAEGLVCDIQHIANSGVRINGGYFVFRH